MLFGRFWSGRFCSLGDFGVGDSGVGDSGVGDFGVGDFGVGDFAPPPILVISTTPTFSKLLLLRYFGSPDVIFEVRETPVN